MYIRRLAKVLLLLISLTSFVFSETEVSGDCAQIKKFVSEEKPNDDYYYVNAIKECIVDAEGKLNEIDVYGQDITFELFKKILKYDSLKILHLDTFELNQSYIDEIGALPNLEELFFSYCEIEKDLNLEPLNGITSLNIKYYENFRSYKNFFNNFKALKKLRINGVDSDDLSEKDIESINSLENLEELTLEELPDNLNFGIFKNLKNLTSLKINFLINDSIPEVIEYLPKLKEFICKACNLETLPDSLLEIESIEHIEITGSGIKEIPKNIGNLKNLKYLNLSYGNIENISEEVGNLEKLTEFIFTENKIKELPSSFEKLKNLKTFNLSFNLLERIPTFLGNLSNLEIINIEGNIIYDRLPESFNDLPNLKEIKIAHNANIRGKTLINESLKVCEYGENYDLCIAKDMQCINNNEYKFGTCNEEEENNNIDNDDECYELYNYFGSNEYESYRNNVEKCTKNKQGKIKALNLRRITIDEDLVKIMENFVNIEELEFSYCKFNKDVNYDSFKNFLNITSLTITDTEENKYLPEFIGELVSLKKLILNFNYVSSFSESIMNNLKNLEYLDLSNNEITEIPENINNLENLKELYLSFNKISKVPEQIEELSQLEILDLDHNLITEFPNEITISKNLKKLIISNNKLSKFPELLKNVENIVTLDLSFNKIFDELPEYLNNFSNLEEFNIYGNVNIKGKTLTNDRLKYCEYSRDYSLCLAKEMACIDEDIKFEPCPSESDPSKGHQCEEIYNKFSEIVKNLYFVCKNNENGKVKQLKTEVPKPKNPQYIIDELGALTDIESLEINMFNFNSDIKLDVFKNLKNIQILNINSYSENALSEIPDVIFSLTTLKELVISNQKISSIPDKITNIKDLKKLEISNNKITTIPEFLGDLKNLETLDLSNNKIDSEIPESFNGLPKLANINFMSNDNIKGKTLTNESLLYCDYPMDANLCIPKKLKCLEFYEFKSCDSSTDNNNNNNNNNDNNDDTKISTDYRCGKGLGRCPSGYCCSKYGWCGTSDKYCSIDEGCNSEFGECRSQRKISSNGKCGGEDGQCPNNQCCNKNGECGTSDDHCFITSGCQP